jgi:ParB/RepB/Spo0J family partition protein
VNEWDTRIPVNEWDTRIPVNEWDTRIPVNEWDTRIPVNEWDTRIPVNEWDTRIPVNEWDTRIPVNEWDTRIPVNEWDTRIPVNEWDTRIPVNEWDTRIPVNEWDTRIPVNEWDTRIPHNPGTKNMNQLDKAIKKNMQIVVAEVSSSFGTENEKLNLLKKNVGKIVAIPTEEIYLNENVRREIDQSSLEFRKLVESVREYGLLQSAVVEVREENSAYKLVCVAGHRRILAARELNLQKVSCLIQQFDDRSKRTGAALAENLNRESLHCIDVAEGYADLLENGWTEDRLAIHFERDKKTIKRYLNIARWADNIKKLIRQHKDKFSTRVVLQEFASRHFENNEALLNAVMLKISGAETNRDAKKNILVRKKIDSYFSEHQEIHTSTKEVVFEILKHLKIIS